MSKCNEGIITLYNKKYYTDKQGNFYNSKNHFVKGSLRKSNYIFISVRIDKIKITLPLHRFVAYEKYGNKLFESECVRHLDGNSLNNSWDNICIGTNIENASDIPKEKRISRALKAASKIKIHNHLDIINYHNIAKSYDETMLKFNISSKGTLNWILKKSYLFQNLND